MDPKLGCFGPLLDPYLEGTARPRQALFGPGVRHWTKEVNIPNPGIRGIWGVLGRYPWGSHLDPILDPFLDPFRSPISGCLPPVGLYGPLDPQVPDPGGPGDDPFWGHFWTPNRSILDLIRTWPNRVLESLPCILAILGHISTPFGPPNRPLLDPYLDGLGHMASGVPPGCHPHGPKGP